MGELAAIDRTRASRAKAPMKKDTASRRRRNGSQRRHVVALRTPPTASSKPALHVDVPTNVPIPFDIGLVDSIKVNRSAVEARSVELGTRRTFKIEAQAASYVSAIRCMDLTTLAGDDTAGRVARLCAKALAPLEEETIAHFGLDGNSITAAAVCVYPAQVKTAVACLEDRIPVASVATGFPTGQTFLDVKLREVELAIRAGAKEIDVVISREKVLTGRWKSLYDEIVAFREVCGTRARMKTILGIGNLETLTNVAAASAVAIAAGSDFIKTSTGFEPTNATLPGGLVMVRQIRRFMDSGLLGKRRVGFKPAGGIRTAKDAMLWLILMLEELGEDWTKPELFRIGASGLLTDIERQLRHLAFGRYANAQYHPMG